MQRTLVALSLLATAACGGGQPAPSSPPAVPPGSGTRASGDSTPDTQQASIEAPVAQTGAASDAPTGPRPPDFELDATDGSSFRLSDHLGKQVVLLDFWATYCDPCLAAMPHLNDLYQAKKSRGLVVVGISIDGPESVAQVRATVARLGVQFPILLDDESSVVAQYNPKVSAPFSVLIGRDGSIVTKREGYTTGKAAALDADIEQALAR